MSKNIFFFFVLFKGNRMAKLGQTQFMAYQGGDATHWTFA